VSKQPFSEEEDKAIVAAHRVHGNHWATIARSLEGRCVLALSGRVRRSPPAARTDNAVKNHWNSTLKRKYGASTEEAEEDEPEPEPAGTAGGRDVRRARGALTGLTAAETEKGAGGRARKSPSAAPSVPSSEAWRGGATANTADLRTHAGAAAVAVDHHPSLSAALQAQAAAQAGLAYSAMLRGEAPAAAAYLPAFWALAVGAMHRGGSMLSSGAEGVGFAAPFAMGNPLRAPAAGHSSVLRPRVVRPGSSQFANTLAEILSGVEVAVSAEPGPPAAEAAGAPAEPQLGPTPAGAPAEPLQGPTPM